MISSPRHLARLGPLVAPVLALALAGCGGTPPERVDLDHPRTVTDGFVWAYRGATATRDGTPLRALSNPDCTSCADFAAWVETSAPGPGTALRRVRAVPDLTASASAEGTFTASYAIEVLTLARDESSLPVVTTEPEDLTWIELSARWAGDRWVIDGVRWRTG